MDYSGKYVGNQFRDEWINNQQSWGMIRLINRTGRVSVKGLVVMPYDFEDNACALTVQGEPDAIGVIAEDGVPVGSLVWVIVAGIAEVLCVNDTAPGYLVRTFVSGDVGYQPGMAIAEPLPAPPFATDKHFAEIGHAIQSRKGLGLVRVVLHFN